MLCLVRPSFPALLAACPQVPGGHSKQTLSYRGSFFGCMANTQISSVKREERFGANQVSSGRVERCVDFGLGMILKFTNSSVKISRVIGVTGESRTGRCSSVRVRRSRAEPLPGHQARIRNGHKSLPKGRLVRRKI